MTLVGQNVGSIRSALDRTDYTAALFTFIRPIITTRIDFHAPTEYMAYTMSDLANTVVLFSAVNDALALLS